MLLSLFLVCFAAHAVSALNNGLALTPPMGWLSWERFRCNVDCENDPDNCISEKLYMRMADLMVSEGFKDAGYVYVNIDDCWPSMQRDDDGKLVADPKRFPSGIKALSKYMHDRGLKLGIYEDFGHLTCAGYPGSEFYMETDANTFASWDVDMLKFDGCNSDPKDMPYGYPVMGRYLNMTGRPILFLCQWPGYLQAQQIKPNYAAVRSSCNQWRNYHDVQDSWDTITRIVDYYGDNQDGFAQYAGPGGWNDPDMSDYGKIAQTCNLWRNFEDVTDSWPSVLGIVDHYGNNVGNFAAHSGPGAWNDPDMLAVGDFGLSYYQQKAQFGMWALFASPLFMSLDLRSMDPMAKALLQNRHIIAINQDPAGKQATRLFESDYGKIAQACNLWRNFEDVTDSWPSVLGIVDHYGNNVGNFAAHAGPGAWNDPDMLVVGDFGLSYYQQKAQFGLWALFASPLFMSLDLRSMDPQAKALLQNRHIIAINQDPAGKQATRLFEVPGSLSVWIKPMAKNGLTAIGLLNKDDQGKPLRYKLSLSDIGFQGNTKYNITEAFENKFVRTVSTSEEFITFIDPTSIYIMLVQRLGN